MRGVAVLPSIAMVFAVQAARADTINLQTGSALTLARGAEVKIRFSAWNYAFHASGSYPTSIGLELIGAVPSAAPVSLPLSTGQFYADFLLEATIESSDGRYSAPLTSPDAGRIGLGAGYLLLEPGTIGGGQGDGSAAIVDASASLSPDLSQQIFGPNIGSRQSSALIVLKNLGNDLVLSAGSGTHLSEAILIPGISGAGNLTTSGVNLSLETITVPEPATFSLIALALGLTGVLWIRRTRGSGNRPRRPCPYIARGFRVASFSNRRE